MGKKHYLVRVKVPTQIDGRIRTAEDADALAHIVTDVNLHTLATMIRYSQVTLEATGQDREEDIPEVDDSEAGEVETEADRTDEVDDQSQDESTESASGDDGDPEGEDEEGPSPAVVELRDYYVSKGLAESVAEALAEVGAGESDEASKVPDRDLLKTVEGIAQWIEKGHELKSLPKIGRIRADAIAKMATPASE